MSEKKFIKKTCGFAKSVVKKTQEIIEISQLKLKMIQIKNKIERKYVRVGYFVYNKQKENDFEFLKVEEEKQKLEVVFSEIDELYKKLKKVEKEYAEIKNYIKREVKNCVKECGCEKTKQKKENNSDSDEDLKTEKIIVKKEEKEEF